MEQGSPFLVVMEDVGRIYVQRRDFLLECYTLRQSFFGSPAPTLSSIVITLAAG